MKAIILKAFGGVENFSMQEINNPQLFEAGVLVKIKATAFNPIDYQMRKGSPESRLLKSVILGREMSGIVEAVHPAVKKCKPGDEVYAYVSNLGSNGTYTEYIAVPEIIIAPKPRNLSFEKAAAIPLVGLTALQTIQKCNLQTRETVFIAGGAGGVGSMVVRLLKEQGINNIITTAGNRESRNRLLALGLTDKNILDYTAADFKMQLSSLKNIDCCIDTVGGIMSELCAELIKIDGRYADIAFLTTANAREILFDKGVTIINVSNYAYGLENDKEKMKYYGDNLDRLTKLIEKGKLSETPIEVIGNLSVETVTKAHDLLEGNSGRGKKLIMKIGD